jgi:thiosulfate dehydrogenase (quinone) large subunit
MTSRQLRDPALVRGGGPPGFLDRFGGVYAALLPLRAFLGFTFVYAGIDKFATKGFLAASGPGSIGEQLETFTRSSPLTPLIEAVALPYPVAIGTLIALGEIAIGLGVLTGLLYRIAAAAGVFTALTLWLTASWSTTPYYYGPDLPVMFGFITLALAGHGGILVVTNLAPFRGGRGSAATAPGSAAAGGIGRRELLQAAVLGLAAISLGAIGRLVLGGGASDTVAGGGGASASPGPSGGATPAPSAAGQTPAASATAAGPVIANANQIGAGQAVAFIIPSSGDPGAVIKLADGKVVAYDLICTHEGCTVGYDTASGDLRCPCHGATFDPAQDGLVLSGPAPRPLSTVPLVIDPVSGDITLAS